MNRTLAGAVVALALCACHRQETIAIRYPEARTSAVVRAAESLPEPDRAFVYEASAANAAAIRLGRLAMERGASDGVRQLGRDIVDRHTELADRLRETARYENHMTLPAPPMTAQQAETYARLSSLSGAAFDAAFLQTAAQMQRETLDSFSREAALGRDPGLRHVAHQTLPLLQHQQLRVMREIEIL